MWQAKLVKDAVKAAVPFQAELRRLKRHFVPYTGNPANSSLALAQGLEQIRLLRSAGADLSGTVLEIGTGWLPIIPLLFDLAGARRLILTDIEKLVDQHTIATARSVIAGAIDQIGEALGEPSSALLARLDQPSAPDYVVPWTPADTGRDSVDIVVSRTVLEHIPPPDLEAMMRALRRVVRPGGMMCHVIDNSDHWEHGDKSISRLNFLRYEDGPFWRLACFNPQNYQNRLRHSDYAALFERTGWVRLVAAGDPDPACLTDLRTLPLAQAYRDRDPRDLAILTSTFLLQRPPDR